MKSRGCQKWGRVNRIEPETSLWYDKKYTKNRYWKGYTTCEKCTIEH